MKRCIKLDEPASLVTFRQAKPDADWDEMRNDPHHGGKEAYTDIKKTLIKGQRCLCAYCEMQIAEEPDDATLEATRHEQRVEHFHPKSDRSTSRNWNLDWSNLWAVCQGGSKKSQKLDTQRFLPPLPENLSCDAFKDHQIEKGKLPLNPEGWMLSPEEIPAFPLLFEFDPNGRPQPHSRNCRDFVPIRNNYDDAGTLVAKTIEHLNLGCHRLNEARRIRRAQVEKDIARERKKNPGASPEEVYLRLMHRYFPRDRDKPWPKFFSIIRWRLGEAAERYLREIGYDG